MNGSVFQPIQLSRTASAPRGCQHGDADDRAFGRAALRISSAICRPGVERYSNDQVWRKYRQMSIRRSPVTLHFASSSQTSITGIDDGLQTVGGFAGREPSEGQQRCGQLCAVVDDVGDRTAAAGARHDAMHAAEEALHAGLAELAVAPGLQGAAKRSFDCQWRLTAASSFGT